MLVRLNVGRLAGKIQDIEPSAARQMISDGRAAVIEYDQGNAEPEGVVKLAAAAEPEKSGSAKPAKVANKK
jgi:hypothetical protein